MINLFDDLPRQADEELFTELLRRKGVRIERIVSTGQSTPADKPYKQEYDEWVLLVSGSAGLWIEGEGERELRPGWLCPDPRSSSPSCNLDGERRAYRLARRTLLLTTHGLRERPLPDLRSRPTRRLLTIYQSLPWKTRQ